LDEICSIGQTLQQRYLFYLEIGGPGEFIAAQLIPSQTSPLDWERGKERFLKIGVQRRQPPLLITG
jgi:hypothetical protein